MQSQRNSTKKSIDEINFIVKENQNEQPQSLPDTKMISFNLPIPNDQDGNSIKQRNPLGRLSTVILRGTSSDEHLIVPQPTMKKAMSSINQKIAEFSGPSTKEEIHDQLIRFIKDQKRTKYAAEFLIEQFSEFRFFKQIMRQISEDLLKQIIFELKLETYKKHQIIFNHNDVGGHMYFILSGKVAILIPSKQNGQDVNTPSNKAPATPSTNTNSSSIQSQNQSSQNTPQNPMINIQSDHQNNSQIFSQVVANQTGSIHNNKSQSTESFKDNLIKKIGFNQFDNISDEEEFEYFKQYKLSHYKQVNTVLPGNTFGEVALEQRIPRTASAVTMTDCELATLSYDSFRKLVSKIYEKIQQEQRSFLKAIPPFNNWPNSGIMIIYNNSEEVEYQINNVIYKEGDKSQYIYFIKEGEIEISKMFKIDKCDTVTMQKKNIQNKRQVIQRVAQGRMFGEFEGIQNLLDQKKKNNILHNNKQKDTFPQRETQAICLTKVKLMRIDSRSFLLNFWAVNNSEDQTFFQIQRQNMYEKINKIQNTINEYQNNNIQNQEIHELSEKLQSNSKIQQNNQIKSILQTPKPKSFSIQSNNSGHFLQNNNKQDQQSLNFINNSKNNQSNDTISSDQTTLMLSEQHIKRSQSTQINYNVSPQGSIVLKPSSQTLISDQLIQAAQNNQLLKQPSLFQRLQMKKNSIFEATPPISGRCGDQQTILDQFNLNIKKSVSNKDNMLSPKQNSPIRGGKRKSTFSHCSPSLTNINQSSPEIKVNSQNQIVDTQTKLESHFSQPRKKFSDSISIMVDTSTFNENQPYPTYGIYEIKENDYQESQGQDQELNQNGQQQENMNQPQLKSQKTIQFSEQNQVQQSIQKQQRSASNEQQIRGNSESSHMGNKKPALLLDQPLKIFQIKDSRKLKVLKQDMKDKFEQWREQDQGKKIIRKKKSQSIKINNQAQSIFSQIQSSLSTKNQNSNFDLRLIKYLQDSQNRIHTPATENNEIRSNIQFDEVIGQSSSNLKNTQNSDSPIEFIQLLRKGKRNPSAVFSSQKKPNDQDMYNGSDTHSINMGVQSLHQFPSENYLSNMTTYQNPNLKIDAASPIKMAHISQEFKQLFDSPSGKFHTPKMQNFYNRVQQSPSSTMYSSKMSSRSGQNFYKFQLNQQQKQDESNTNRQFMSQQSSRLSKPKSISIMEEVKVPENIVKQNSQKYSTTNKNMSDGRYFKALNNINSPHNNQVLNNASTQLENAHSLQEQIQTNSINILSNQNREFYHQHSLAYLDQSPTKFKNHITFKGENVMKSASQPSLIPFQGSINAIQSSSQIKQQLNQVQSLIQPLSAISQPNPLKKNLITNSRGIHNQVQTLQQASKLQPTIKNQESQNNQKKQIKGIFMMSGMSQRENKQIGQYSSLTHIDFDQQIGSNLQVHTTRVQQPQIKQIIQQ